MKKLLQLCVIACCVVFASCSNDDSTPNTALEGQNGFEFDKTAYTTEIVYVTPSNEIILSSKQIADMDTAFAVNYAKFATQDEILSERTYSVGTTLSQCTAIRLGNWENGNLESGDTILGEENVTAGFMRVVEMDRIAQTIDLIFEFQRQDGKLVAGQYRGNFELAEF